MRPLYIFDLDGTLALIEHRRHFVKGDKKDWEAFYAACVDDEPNMPVINTLNCLSNVGADIWIWSGRSDEVRNQSVAWLHINTCLTYREIQSVLVTRKAGDHSSDDDLKREWLQVSDWPEHNDMEFPHSDAEVRWSDESGHYAEVEYVRTDLVVSRKAANEIERLRVVIADLIDPMQRVIAISDRKHDAWDAAKAAIAKATGE